VLQISMYHAWHVFEALKHVRTYPTLASLSMLGIQQYGYTLCWVPLRCRCAVLFWHWNVLEVQCILTVLLCH
jgi:hypothetical protein